MAYDYKYERLLYTIQHGEDREAIALFTSSAYDVNEEVPYIFEDMKRYIITPLYWAVRHRRSKICKYLLKNGARPYQHAVYEYYPLHEACNRGYQEVVQEFVDANCELNVVTIDMDTSLHISCMRGHIGCVHVLLQAGASYTTKNKAGHTPLEVALYYKHDDLVQLFKHFDKATVRAPSPQSQQPAHTHENPVPSAHHVPACQLQRRHSHSSPSDHAASRRTARPQSVVYTETGGGAAMVVGSLSIPVTTRNRSHSHQSLSTSSTQMQSYTQSQQSILHSSVSSNSQSPQSCPTVSTLVSIADSPSPVETDGTAKSTSIPAKHQKFGSSPIHLEESTTKPEEFSRWSSTKSPGVSKQGSCPFPSANSIPAESQIHHLHFQKHPLSKSQRSPQMHHPRHADRPLSGSISHPEFQITKRELIPTDRTASCDELFLRDTTSSGRRRRVSPVRERINNLSKHMWDSLESKVCTFPPQFENPFLDAFHRVLREMAAVFGFTAVQYQSLLETASSPICSVHSTPDSTRLPSLQEGHNGVKYELLEGPSELRLGIPSAGFACLVFRVRLQTYLHSLHGEKAMLKVIVRAFNLMRREESDQYYRIRDHPATALQESSQEATILQLLPSHPNLTGLLHHFKGGSEGFAKYAKKLDHEDPPTAYAFSPAAEFFIFPTYRKSLLEYFQEVQHDEDKILTVLSQVLLGIAHLNRYHVAHCAVRAENVFLNEKEDVFTLGNFSQAINLKPRTLESLRSAVSMLKASHSCVLSPEVLKSLHSETDSIPITGNLDSLFSKNDCYAAGRMLYTLLLGKSHGYFGLECCAMEETPYIESLSLRCNQILRKLAAYNPKERISAFEGAMCCMVLLFGPRGTEMSTANECHRWIFSECMEFYMQPALKGYPSDFSDSKSKLRYLYLTVADPVKVWEACKLLNIR